MDGPVVLPVIARGLFNGEYSKADLLADVFGGRLPAWRGPTIATWSEFVVDAAVLEALRLREKARGFIRRDMHLPVTRLKQVVDALWGVSVRLDGGDLSNLAAAKVVGIKEIPVEHKGRSWTRYEYNFADTIRFLAARDGSDHVLDLAELAHLTSTGRDLSPSRRSLRDAEAA
jgi:hypothetical protein